MDLRFTPEELAFREEVRDFIRNELPETTRRKMLAGKRPSKDEIVAWQRILNRRGWAVYNWPREWATPAGARSSNTSFRKNCSRPRRRSRSPSGVTMVGPVIIAAGSEVQKRQFLPRIANLDDWWCQGFSEPGAGSDLAALRTSAKRVGDHYVVNGQKTWTTLAQYADWIFCLVRTDPQAKKQEGISFLLIDMKSKGITVRPIVTIDGGHEVNEVFFDEVEVPVENRVGEENRGWDYAKLLLGRERTGIARVGASKERLRRIRELAALELSGGQPLIEDERFPEKLVALEVELKALEITQLRVVAAERSRTDNRPDPASSILKIKGHRDPAGNDRTAAGGGRTLCDASAVRRLGGGLERAARWPRLGRTDRADLFQCAKSLDLWRH